MFRKLFLCWLFVFNMILAGSQNFSTTMKGAFDACMALRAAVGSSNTSGLISANDLLKACHILVPTNVKVVTQDTPSIEGHFIWDERFVDELIFSGDVRGFAQRYAEAPITRGKANDKTVYIKTFTVGAKDTTALSFESRGHVELAVISEPGGKVTVRLYDATNHVSYNDTVDVPTGCPFRFRIIELPGTDLCSLEMDVINCSDKDISFVFIRNR